jgi:hypothetical protein
MGLATTAPLTRDRFHIGGTWVTPSGSLTIEFQQTKAIQR